MPGGWVLQVTQKHDDFTERIAASSYIPMGKILLLLFTSNTSSEHSIHGLTGTMQTWLPDFGAQVPQVLMAVCLRRP